MIKNANYKIDNKLSNIIIWVMISLFIVNATHLLSYSVIILNSEIISIVNKLIILILLLNNVNNIIARLKIISQLYILLSILIALSDMVLFNELVEYQYKNVVTYFTTIFPVVLVLLCIDDYDMLFYKIINVSKMIIFMSAFVLLVMLLFKMNYKYSQGYSVSLVLPICCMFYNFYIVKNKKRYLFLLMSGIGILNVLLLGSRGSLISIICYLLILQIKNVKSPSKIIMLFIFYVGLLVIIINYKLIMVFIADLADGFGINSRSIRLLADKTFYLSGREKIYSKVFDYILSNPFSVNGIAIEYKILDGAYSHNLFLTILSSFGVVFGIVIIINLYIMFLYSLVLNMNTGRGNLIILFFSISVPILMVSGTLWTSMYFWMWLMLCFKNNEYWLAKITNKID